MPTYCTYDEIKTQSRAWAQALDLTSRAPLPNAADYEQVIFTGCGSTYYLSLAAAALYQDDEFHARYRLDELARRLVHARNTADVA